MVQSRPVHSGLSLIELLATIAILAVLVTAAGFFIVSYVNYAQQQSDHQSLVVLNSALTRYKCEGGDITSLTHGANIGRVLGNLQTPITFSGHGHIVMQAGATYPARSLSEAGDQSQYHFTRCNTYAASDYSAPTGGGGPSYPYGLGVGYMANDGSTDYNFSCDVTSPGYFAVKAGGTTTVYLGGANPSVSGSNTSLTFWSCAGPDGPDDGTNSVASGDITNVHADSGGFGPLKLTSLDVSGLINLQYLDCSMNRSLTSLNVSNCANLQTLQCAWCPLTSLQISGFTKLQTLIVSFTSIPSLDASGCPLLTTLYCQGRGTTLSIKVTGDTSLPAPCTDWSTNFITDPGATVTGP